MLRPFLCVLAAVTMLPDEGQWLPTQVRQMDWAALKQRGFHRTLATTVRWAPAAELPSAKRRCTLLLLEVLGEGLFVDPYELESLQLWRRRQAEAGADEAWLRRRDEKRAAAAAAAAVVAA